MRNDFVFGRAHLVRMVRRKLRQQSWYAREWIAHKNLRQTDIVARTAFNKGQVSDYVNGKRRWNEDVLAEFAQALGIDQADLLRPPQAVENELASYVMKMDESRRVRALRLLKAIEREEAA